MKMRKEVSFEDFMAEVTHLVLRTQKFFERNPQARARLQSVGTILLLVLLLWMVKGMMTDDVTQSGVSESNANNIQHLFFQDDEDTITTESLFDTQTLVSISVEDEQLRSQLVNFFKKHNQAKVSTIDTILSKFRGKENELNEALRKKYGSDLTSLSASVGNEVSPTVTQQMHETQTTKSILSSTVKKKEDPESQLRRFFLKYNPQKLSTVKQLIKKYPLDKLNTKLKNKYGHDLNEQIPDPPQKNSFGPSTTLLERQAQVFFSKHRPGESQEWVKRIVEMYGESLEQHLTRTYGYKLDGAVSPLDISQLSLRLSSFFQKYNPEKLSTVEEAAKRYSPDLDKLNTILRDKYGVDLNGKRKDRVTPESDLLRVHFKVISATDNVTRSGSFLKSLFQTAELEDNHFVHNEEEFADPDNMSTNEAEVPSEVDSSVNNGKVRLLCFGLPYTGIEHIRLFAEEVLSFSIFSEIDLYKRLKHALFSPVQHPHFDVFFDRSAVIGVTASYFFQEIMAAYPDAIVVITVREVEKWWADIKVKNNDWLCKNIQDDICAEVAETLENILMGWSNTYEQSPQRKEFYFKMAYEDFYDRLLSLTPRSRRILVDAHGHRPLESFQQLASIFSIDADKWITKNLSPKTISEGAPNLSLLVPDSLATLHHLHRADSARPCQSKFVLFSMEASDSEIVSSMFKTLGMIKTLSNTMEWHDVFLERSSNVAIDSIRKALLRGSDVQLSFEDDFVGGAPVLFFARDFLKQAPTAKFMLVTKRMQAWNKDVRCYLETHAKSQKKSLLRTTVDIPIALNAVYLRLFGFSAQDYHKLEVSDHYLRRRYQDSVDLINIIVPPNLLRVFDPREDLVEGLCEYLKPTFTCPRSFEITDHDFAAAVGC
jgi:hypothetical protein